MYDKDAEVEISWGLFHKEKKNLFQVTGKPQLKPASVRQWDLHLGTVENSGSGFFISHLPTPFWNQEPKIIIVHTDTLKAYIIWKWISHPRAN